MWLVVEAWIFLVLNVLVLQLELSEQSLFELSLLRRADRLPWHLLHIELVEQVLIELVSVDNRLPSAKMHVIISPVCALVTQTFRNGRAVLAIKLRS